MTSIYNGYTESHDVTAERWQRIKLQGEIVNLEMLIQDSDCECSPISGLPCYHCQWISELKSKRANLERIQGNTNLYFYRR